jgi:transposase, IS5 family
LQGQFGFWDVEDRLKEFSAEGDPLARLSKTVDLELFRPALVQALGRSDLPKVGRPAFDPVLKFKMLVLGAMHGLSLQQTDYLVRDRLSWMRFRGFSPGELESTATTLRYETSMRWKGQFVCLRFVGT